MKRILVPTDFSPNAGYARDMALEIASRTRAELCFMHAFSTPTDWVHMEMLTARGANLPDVEKEKYFPELKAKIGKARHQLMMYDTIAARKKLTSCTEFSFGDPATDIVDVAGKKEASLIVMGAHGAGKSRTLLTGTTTQKVIRHASCPVLVLRNRPKGFPIKNIVFISDYAEKGYMECFGQAFDFASWFNAAIHLLFVNTPAHFEESQFSMMKMEDVTLKYFKQEITRNIFNAYTIEEGAVAFAHSVNADLIAAPTHGYKGLKRLASHVVAESLVHHSEIPILSIPFPHLNKKPRKK